MRGRLESRGLIQASDWDLYGIAGNGGQCGGEGGGTVFKITPAGTFSTVYTACPPLGGFGTGELVQATDGNFYGGIGSGVPGQASIFRLTPGGTLTTLYTFCTQPGCPDGEGLYSLAQAADGNLYGTTQAGGVACPYNLYYGCSAGGAEAATGPTGEAPEAEIVSDRFEGPTKKRWAAYRKAKKTAT
jgi:uncharacterized repeat protein (TIGR03803 family)